jgi:hypothetical protein
MSRIEQSQVEPGIQFKGQICKAEAVKVNHISSARLQREQMPVEAMQLNAHAIRGAIRKCRRA